MKFDFLMNERIFSFNISSEGKINCISSNLYAKEQARELVGMSIYDVADELFDSEVFENKSFAEEFKQKISDSIQTGESFIKPYTITDTSLKSEFSYSFVFGVDVYSNENCNNATVKFADFKVLYQKDAFYQAVLNEYDSIFESIRDLKTYGEFLIDYTESKELFYGNSALPNMLGLQPSDDNMYVLSRAANKYNNGVIVLNDEVFYQLGMLASGEIQSMNVDWMYNNKTFSIEAKVIKRDASGKCLLIGGVIIDITRFKDYEELENLKSIYELAITSGGIGIFHYDVDKYGKDNFEANDIYAEMLGLTSIASDLYHVSDFEKAIIELEDEISSNEDVKKSLNKLLKGEVEGTTDDIIKIKHLETGEIKYLLSSSKISLRFPDGSPKKFGGIVIDITDRIMKEKNQIEYAYTDELTKLANNRKLFKDMRTRKDGIGMFFDLDNFKKVNDQFGHLVGDKVLKIFSETIKLLCDKEKTLYPYRLYGDEFFIFAEGKSVLFANRFDDRLRELAKEEILSYNKDIVFDFSMGVSVYSVNQDIDDFIKASDYQMYKTKIKKKQMN